MHRLRYLPFGHRASASLFACGIVSAPETVKISNLGRRRMWNVVKIFWRLGKDKMGTQIPLGTQWREVSGAHSGGVLETGTCEIGTC